MKDKSFSFWCFNPQKGHDKVYHLHLMYVGENKFDVLCEYGSRGGSLTFHVWAEGVSEEAANILFDKMVRLRLKHEYKQVDPDLILKKEVTSKKFVETIAHSVVL